MTKDQPTPIPRPDDRVMSPTIGLWAAYADYLEWKIKELKKPAKPTKSTKPTKKG